MPLADDIIDTYFGRSTVADQFGVALLLRGREVNVPGYQRAVVKRGEWQIRGTTAKREVVWPGFGQAVEFDSTALMRGDEALKVWPEASAAQIPVGMGYRATIEVDLADL